MIARLWKGSRHNVQDFPGFGAFSLLFYLYLYAPQQATLQACAGSCARQQFG